MFWTMLLLLYFAGLAAVLIFFAASAEVNERADAWADDLADYLRFRSYRDAA